MIVPIIKHYQLSFSFLASNLLLNHYTLIHSNYYAKDLVKLKLYNLLIFKTIFIKIRCKKTCNSTLVIQLDTKSYKIRYLLKPCYLMMFTEIRTVVLLLFFPKMRECPSIPCIIFDAGVGVEDTGSNIRPVTCKIEYDFYFVKSRKL